MPVQSAGPRLYRSIPFKHLGKGSATGQTRAQNIALNLVPFVDTMTILVTFLLMVFSTSGELLKAQKGLELPEAGRKDVLQQAPIITITKSEVSFMGTTVATVDSLLRDDTPTLRIEALFERLQAVGKKTEQDISVAATRRPRRPVTTSRPASSTATTCARWVSPSFRPTRRRTRVSSRWWSPPRSTPSSTISCSR